MSQIIAYSDDAQGPMVVSQDNPLPVYLAETPGTIPVSLRTPAAPLNSTSAAYEASRVIKSTGGVLYDLIGFNSKGSAQFIQLHDANSVPAEGAVPKVVLTAATVANFSQSFGVYGMAFTNGIVVVNSSTGPAKTIGSADCFFSARFA